MPPFTPPPPAAYSVLTAPRHTKPKGPAKRGFIINMDNETCIDPQHCAPDCTIDPMPVEATLAFAYIKFQQYGNISHRDEALSRGTVFGDLYMPYNRTKRRTNDGCCK